MNIVRAIFSSLATVVSIYSSLCLVRIFLTWIPQANYSKFGQFMSAICDPYLNIFSRVRFLRIGMIDFSPILAFALLSALASVFAKIAQTGSLSFAFILSMLVSLIWNIFASILIILIIMLIIRLILLATNKNSVGFWSQVDGMIYKIASPIKNLFWKNKFLSMTGTTAIALVESILIYAVGRVAIYYLLVLIRLIPF